MGSISELFQGPPVRRLHPTAHLLRDKRSRPDVSKVHIVFRRLRDFVGFKPARLHGIVLDDEGNYIDALDVAWEDDLHRDLVELGFKAESLSNEAERFGFALKNIFRPLEERWGEGYFSSVLMLVVRSFGLEEETPLKEVLQHVHINAPYDGGNLEDKLDSVKDCFKKVAQALTQKLNYTQEEATSILTGMLAYYLDERFTVSDRRKLGMLR